MKQAETNGNGQGRQPAKMGDIRLQRAASDGWELFVAGRRVVDGLDFRQVLEIINGRVDLGALRERGELVTNGN